METRAEVGAALTKPGRASTVRWPGLGKRDRKVDARNQCLKPRNCSTGSNLTDEGRTQRTPPPGAATSKPVFRCRWGGHAEGLRRRRWRCCRGRAGRLTGRPNGDERGKRPLAPSHRGWWVGVSSADGGGSWRRSRSSPSVRKARTWPRGPARQQWGTGRPGGHR